MAMYKIEWEERTLECIRFLHDHGGAYGGVRLTII
jgi:hypothetical protein